MKGCFPEANREGQGWQKTLFTNLLVQTVGLDIFKWEHQKKCALKQNIEASFYTLHWGLKKITFTLYTYVLAKILQNGAKFIQKLIPGFKNYLRNSNNFRQAVESQKILNLTGVRVQKIHPFS